MNLTDLVVLGCVAAIGFTVSLFFAGVALPAGDIQDAAKMGAGLGSGERVRLLRAAELSDGITGAGQNGSILRKIARF